MIKRLIDWMTSKANTCSGGSFIFFTMILPVIIITAILAARDYSKETKAEAFTRNCTINKGIAVRDLDNKMRCVPMFSAKGRP